MTHAELVTASLGKRLAARLIDLVLVLVGGFIALVVLVMIFRPTPPNPSPWPLLLVLILMLAYTLLADGLFKGQSIGKKILGLTVIDSQSHQPCSFKQSALRNLVLFLVVIDQIYVFKPDQQRLGDRWAGTQVMMRGQ